MTRSVAARKLGRLGGLARKKSLQPERLREIALQGAIARVESFRLARMIETNFRYVAAIRELRPPRKVLSRSTCIGPLPGPYAKEKKN